MQQRDNETNSGTATTRDVIAEATKRDGSATKTISLLTMVFLPGTAVAVSRIATALFCPLWTQVVDF